MLHLKSVTSDEWVKCALANLDAILVDHALCEQKAAITALSFVSKYPWDDEIVEKLSALAAEEAEHLQRVARLCHGRGLSLVHPERDVYVKKLLSCTRDGQTEHRVDRLLVCALIEARSCERMKLLAENLDDPALREFYDELWRTEAGHHTLFVDLAISTLQKSGVPPELAKANIEARLDEVATHEANVLKDVPLRAAIH